MKSRKPLPLEQLRSVLQVLRTRAPVITTPQPLALGAGAAVLDLAPELGVSRRTLRRALHFWTARRAYLKALAAPGAVRYALDGTPVGPVTAEHQQAALQELQRRKPPAKPATPAPAKPATPVPAKSATPVTAKPATPVTAVALGRPILTLKRKTQ